MAATRPTTLILSTACFALLATEASAASCKNFVREAQVAFAKEVILLRRYELEAADRLKGLDSRPFVHMRDEAKKASAIIADESKLKDEEALARCTNPTRPIRKICAGSAQMLIAILEQHVVSEKDPAKATDYDRPQYATAMAECETLIGLKPLATRIRANE